MSTTSERLPFDAAVKLARELTDELRPHVKRLRVAGSLRRLRPDVGDIEIVAEPHMYAGNLFGDLQPDLHLVRFTARSWGRLAISGDRQIRVNDVKGLVGFSCEIYLVHPPAQWGSILAIRTGPRELCQIAMGRMLGRGLKHREGQVIRRADRHVIETPTEDAFFACADLPKLGPRLRDNQAHDLLEEIRKARAARGIQPHG